MAKITKKRKTKTSKRQSCGIFQLLNSRVTPLRFVFLLALLTPVFVIYSIQITKPAWVPHPPPPAWATLEESALFNQSLFHWQFTKGMCNGCNTYIHKRIISPRASICSPTASGKNPELLILVATIHRHTRYRTLIRETWATHTQNNTGRARLVFLFGLDPGRNLTDEKLLQQEAAANGDILQDSFNSTYRRGGEVQLIMGYRWALEKCSNITHVLKVSDDTFVSIPKVLELIRKTQLDGTVWGQCYKRSQPNRAKRHRWYVSFEDWPPKMYPHYCAGAYLGVTMPVMRKILLVSPYIAWFSGNDDVLVGMCAEKIGIQMKDVPGFRVWDRTNPCNIQDPKHAIHFHGQSPEVMSYFWERRDCFEGGYIHRGPKNDPKQYPTLPPPTKTLQKSGKTFGKH